MRNTMFEQAATSGGWCNFRQKKISIPWLGVTDANFFGFRFEFEFFHRFIKIEIMFCIKMGKKHLEKLDLE